MAAANRLNSNRYPLSGKLRCLGFGCLDLGHDYLISTLTLRRATGGSPLCLAAEANSLTFQTLDLERGSQTTGFRLRR